MNWGFYTWIVLVLLVCVTVFYNPLDFNREWIITWILLSFIGYTISEKDTKKQQRKLKNGK